MDKGYWRGIHIGPELGAEDQIALDRALAQQQLEANRKKTRGSRFLIEQVAFDLINQRFGLTHDEARVNCGPEGVVVLLKTHFNFAGRLAEITNDPTTPDLVKDAARRSLRKMRRQIEREESKAATTTTDYGYAP